MQPAMDKKISPSFLLVVFSVFLLTDPCFGQSNVPMTQNLTIAAIRLWSDSPKSINQGRVDLQMMNEVWGSICDAGWDETTTARNVNTTCAMLGFMSGGKKVPNTFGAGNKNFVIENAMCPVNATSWYQCTQYFVKKCGPQDEALAVECIPDPGGSNFVQLMKTGSVPGSAGSPSSSPTLSTVILNGTNTSTCTASPNARLISGDGVNASVGNGFVQVKINDQWGFVCTDTWNQAAAEVICRQLCYESVYGFTPLPGIIAKSVPDQQNRVFALSSVNCKGTENSLQDCPVINPSAVCSPDTVLAGVQCRPDCCNGDDKPLVLPSMNCNTEVLSANFTKAKFPLVTDSNIFMVNSVPTQCMNVTTNQAGDVLVNVSINSGCGVGLQENSTHITYAVSFRAVWVSGTMVVNSYSNVRYDLVCSLPKTYQITNRMEPYTLAPNVTIIQQYNFSLGMDLYTDCNFTTALSGVGSVYLVEVGHWLNAAVSVNNYDPRTKLVLTDCDAYPVIPYTAYTPVVKLIQDRCPVDPTLSIYSLDNRRQGFQVRAFWFPGYSMTYIRCSINICLVNSTSPECDRACRNPSLGRRKKKRSASNLGSMTVDTKTIFMYNSSDAGATKLVQSLSENSQPGSPSDGTTTVVPSTSSTLTTVTTSTSGPQNKPGDDPRQNQQTQQQQLVGREANSSSLIIAQQGQVSELKGDDPNGASFILLSWVTSTATFAAWLMYLQAGGWLG